MKLPVDRRMYQGHQIHETTKSGCREVLAELRRDTAGFVSAGVVGPDGFEVAALTSTALDVAKVAALTSTLLAVSEAFVLECRRSSCRQLILEGADGSTTLMVGIPVEDANYCMFVIVGNEETLGLVFYRVRACASVVQKILSANYDRKRTRHEA